MNLGEIARLCGASQMLDDETARFVPTGFSIDSRTISRGDLFIALAGEQVDGHRYVLEVFDKGACAALVIHKRLPFANDLGAHAGRLLFVENTTCAMQQLAARVIAKWHRPVIAVTGSAGKTTIKDLTAEVMSSAGRVLKSHGNLNTSYGLPLTVSRMISDGAAPGDFDYAVLEMGMSSYGEIARLTDLAPPEVGIVANVGTAHIEFFGSLKAIARAKAEMVESVKSGGTAVLNADDPLVWEMRSLRDDLGIISFGIDATADVTAGEIIVEDDLSGTRFVLKTPHGSSEVKMQMIGRHNVYNALAAAAAGCCFGLSSDVIAQRLDLAAATKMRGELIRFPNGVSVIDDTYNSNPQALMLAVRAISGAKGFKRRIVVAGEMLELGELGPQLHRDCGSQMASLGIDRLIGVRGQAAQIVEGAIQNGMKQEQAIFFETPGEAAASLIEEAASGDLILVKGSRGVRTERVIEALREEFEAPTS